MIARCEFCGSKRSCSLFEAQDLLYGKIVHSEMVRCNDCGLIYLWPQPTELLNSYPAGYGPHVGQRDSADLAYSTGYMAGLLRKAKLVGQYQHGPLLDIGCGAGQFLAITNDLGNLPSYGMDRSEKAVQYAQQRWGVKVWVGDVPGIPLPDSSISVVTMWHVLEHLPHPLLALHDVARVLWPSGVLILACPVIDSWEARIFGRYWAGYDAPRHLFVYSRQTLRRMLQCAGFEVSEVPNLVWGYNSARLSSIFWLKKHSIFLRNRCLLRGTAALIGISTAAVFSLISRFLGNCASVAVFIARKCSSLKG